MGQDEAAGARWERYRRAIAAEPMPCALVDVDAFDANADALVAKARVAGKTLRVASKSVRCVTLLERFFQRAGAVGRGLMTYAATETGFLADAGFDDFLLAYPTVQKSDVELLAGLAKRGKTVAVVVDSPEHLDALEAAAAAAGSKVGVVVEVDVSFRPVAGVHLGVRRSPLRTAEDAVGLAARAAACPHLSVAGVMTYDAQLAGVTDNNPFTRWMNGPKRAMKLASRRDVEATRAKIASALAANGVTLRLFNGGGTGSLDWAARDSALTEVTAGSGLVDSQLFDYYRDLHLAPAAYFALQVTRRPTPGIVTCHGGGLVASGEAGPDRLPRPALPEGCRLIPVEGAGEVQTPVVLPPGTTLRLGDPIFFRHAKAGELAEHFNEYLLVRGDRVEARVPTYRGMGKVFLG